MLKWQTRACDMLLVNSCDKQKVYNMEQDLYFKDMFDDKENVLIVIIFM